MVTPVEGVPAVHADSRGLVPLLVGGNGDLRFRQVLFPFEIFASAGTLLNIHTPNGGEIKLTAFNHAGHRCRPVPSRCSCDVPLLQDLFLEEKELHGNEPDYAYFRACKFFPLRMEVYFPLSLAQLFALCSCF